MPCWTKTEQQIDLSRADIGLLRAALESLGYFINSESYSRARGFEFSADHYAQRTSVVIQGGQLKATGAGAGWDLTQTINAVKRAYSQQVVEAGLRRFGWQVQKKDENRLVARRRA